MTYFEENIACKASIEGKRFSPLGKQQIPGAEYPVPVSDARLLLQPNLLGLLRSFTSVVLRFCDLQVVRSDSSGHSEMGECCYLFSRGQTEELSRSSPWGKEGSAVAFLGAGVRSRTAEAGGRAERLKLSATFWLYADESG